MLRKLTSSGLIFLVLVVGVFAATSCAGQKAEKSPPVTETTSIAGTYVCDRLPRFSIEIERDSTFSINEGGHTLYSGTWEVSHDRIRFHLLSEGEWKGADWDGCILSQGSRIGLDMDTTATSKLLGPPIGGSELGTDAIFEKR